MNGFNDMRFPVGLIGRMHRVDLAGIRNDNLIPNAPATGQVPQFEF